MSIASHLCTPRRILLVGWLGLFIYGAPGHMSYDSAAQLLEARRGYYSDGHPPAMAALWRLTEVFITGPMGMLLIQTSTMLLGVYLLLARRMPPRAARSRQRCFYGFRSSRTRCRRSGRTR